MHNIFDAISPLSAQNWRGLPPVAQMHKKRPFLRAGVEGRQSRAEGSRGGGHLWLVRRLWVMVICIRVMGVVIGYVRRAPRYGPLRAL
ncbi:hypothetical protein DVQ99_00015 [Yersinia enterocolitica]|nr:hypothetical protein [Yersinia enterocolitica]